MASSRKAARDLVAELDAALAGWLATRLQAVPAPDPLLIVAFSGGLDSSVLLDRLAVLSARGVSLAGPERVVHPRLLVIHVHHGLQAVADEWPAHCEAFARQRGLTFEGLRVQLDPHWRRKGLEAAAREARYQSLAVRAQALQATALLTAHHADDQLETLLLRLARGTGLDGMVGIEPVRAWPAGGPDCQLWRPLLAFDRACLLAIAQSLGLNWVEDPSNSDSSLRRNALRQRVLPALDATLPNWRQGFARAQQLLVEARVRLDEVAAKDLQACRFLQIPEGLEWRDAKTFSQAPLPDGSRYLNGERLAELDAPRRRAVWRAWFQQLGLKMPSLRRLEAIDRCLALSGRGEVELDGWRLRRWRDCIEASPLDASSEAASSRLPLPSRGGVGEHFSDVALVWQGEAQLWVPAWNGTLLFAECGAGQGLDERWLRGRRLRLSRARAGARLRLSERSHQRTLKGLYQSAGIPPWRRLELPLVFADDALVFAAGLGMNHEWIHAVPGGVRIDWRA